MNEQEKPALSDAELWRLVRKTKAQDDSETEPADALLIAAALDDRLDEAARERFESHLLRSPQALDLWLSARSALNERPENERPEEAVPPAVVRRAQRLVEPAPQPELDRPQGRGWLAGLFTLPSGIFQPVGMAAAVAVLLASLAGFQLGKLGYESAAMTDELLAREISLDLGPDDFL